jgi:hypothetical protein
MNNFIEATLKKIKDEKIQPDERWKYLLRKYSVWVVFFLIELICALAISATYYLSTQIDWEISGIGVGRAILFISPFLPYFWIILAIFFAIAAFLGLRRTEKGYRLSIFKMIVIILLILFGFGAFSLAFGLGKRADQDIGKIFSSYSSNVTTKEAQWSRPEQGFLGGTVLSGSANNFQLQDFSGKNWNVETNSGTEIRPSAEVSAGEKIKILGQEENTQTFQAEEIRPWSGKGEGGKMKMGGQNGPTSNQENGSKK